MTFPEPPKCLEKYNWSFMEFDQPLEFREDKESRDWANLYQEAWWNLMIEKGWK